MRKKHKDVVLSKIKELDLLWFIHHGWKFVSIPLSYYCNHQFAAPMFAGLVMTYSCNMRCVMCELWDRNQGRKELSTEKWKKIVDDFKRLGVGGIGIGGGEPMLRPDVYEIIAHIKKGKSLPVAMATNGYFLTDKDVVARLFDAGLDNITVSLDSINPATHDKFRNTESAYVNAIKAIKNIVEARKKYPHIKCGMTVVISKVNSNDLFRLIDLAQDLGATSINFVPGQLTGKENECDERGKSLFLTKAQLDEIDGVLDKLVRFKKENGFIDNSVRYLNLMKYYFRGRPLPINCLAGQTAYYVDPFGDIYPCWGWLERKKEIGNINDVDLVRFWRSKKYNMYRKEINRCHDCYFNCLVEFGLIYQSVKNIHKENVRVVD